MKGFKVLKYVIRRSPKSPRNSRATNSVLSGISGRGHRPLGDQGGASRDVMSSSPVSWGASPQSNLSPSKDVRLPVQLQRVMAAEAEAAREARAKVIAAQGEQKASQALKMASEVISESSGALQLRYLQVRRRKYRHDDIVQQCPMVVSDSVIRYINHDITIYWIKLVKGLVRKTEASHCITLILSQTLSGISAEKNSTVIFPIPIDIIKKYLSTDNWLLFKTLLNFTELFCKIVLLLTMLTQLKIEPVQTMQPFIALFLSNFTWIVNVC